MAGVGQLRITQIKSDIGSKKDQKDTLRALGLRRIRHQVTKPDTSAVRGMVNKVVHLVAVEELE